MSQERVRHEIKYGGRTFQNDYVFAAEIAALRARRTGQFQELVILEWIKTQRLQGTYLDVGAHIGNHTLFFAAFCPSTMVIAIEGHPTIREILVDNLKRNLNATEHEKVLIFHAAAWSKSNETVGFAEIPRNNAGHTHIINTGGRKGELAKAHQKTLAIDDIPITESTVIPNKLVLLKIDVEDAEHEVIAGALRTIDKYRPVIIIERHNKEQLADTLRQLAKWKYEVVNRWDGVHTFALRSRP